jgi:hypothetical protein
MEGKKQDYYECQNCKDIVEGGQNCSCKQNDFIELFKCAKCECFEEYLIDTLCVECDAEESEAFEANKSTEESLNNQR